MSRKSKWVSYVLVAVGTFFMAAGVNLIYEPLHMVTGGFSGFAIIIKSLTEPVIPGGIPIWFTTTVLNVPLFILASLRKGLSFVKGTLFAAACFSAALAWIPVIDVGSRDYLMAALMGGAITGAGLALVFSQSFSTGGTDLLSTLIQMHLPAVSVARLLLVIDGIIVIAGVGIFGLQSGLYAIIAVFITTKVMDGLLEGLKFAKMVTIITRQGDAIGKIIMTEVDRGVTKLPAAGMYSGEPQDMLMCVVSRREAVKVRDAVWKLDPNAFFIVSEVHEVFGEGFIKNS